MQRDIYKDEKKKITRRVICNIAFERTYIKKKLSMHVEINVKGINYD